jgi:hypothetical protein
MVEYIGLGLQADLVPKICSAVGSNGPMRRPYRLDEEISRERFVENEVDPQAWNAEAPFFSDQSH